MVKAAELIGISFDVGELSLASRHFLSTVNEAIEGNDELQAYVEQLEEDADADIERSDRLVTEIETFLRDQP